MTMKCSFTFSQMTRTLVSFCCLFAARCLLLLLVSHWHNHHYHHHFPSLITRIIINGINDDKKEFLFKKKFNHGIYFTKDISFRIWHGSLIWHIKCIDMSIRLTL